MRHGHERNGGREGPTGARGHASEAMPSCLRSHEATNSDVTAALPDSNERSRVERHRVCGHPTCGEPGPREVEEPSRVAHREVDAAVAPRVTEIFMPVGSMQGNAV